ncbi:Hypothetical protein FKW44_007324 [Caligus rogercresseyi]|uniref:Uncharacterized protein n=1 Tax=Caligus rogercresseyi TaxID=217165 RepID=A0A7T8KEK6_CALRO|nr:Hypothetical protein FKW44_007324 [Caligus rogercresseyi]
MASKEGLKDCCGGGDAREVRRFRHHGPAFSHHMCRRFLPTSTETRAALPCSTFFL